MAAKGSQVNVAEAPVKLGGGTKLIVTNHDAANSVFLGGSGVTAATGYELKAGAAPLEIDARTDDLYAIAAVVGPVRVDVLAMRAPN